MEIWDAYYPDGTPAGRELIRGEAIPAGLYHLVCEVLVCHEDGTFLIMHRHPEKPIHPGCPEATAGGSALRGEDALACIRRELKEETGLDGFDFRQVHYEVSERWPTLHYSFVCRYNGPKDAVQLQEGETVGYEWLDRDSFRAFIASDRIIPGQKQRYQEYYRQQELL